MQLLFVVKRNPDAFPPRTGFGRAMLKLAPIFRFFKSPEGILALRSGIVSVALWIPAVCPQSAWFYYENKGIWALIMAQVRRFYVYNMANSNYFIVSLGWQRMRGIK